MKLRLLFSLTVSFLLLFILTDCSQAISTAQLPKITNSPMVVLTSTLFPIPTITETIPAPSPTVTSTPLPAVPTSCFDKAKTNEVVEAFLGKFGYPSYQDYLDKLPPNQLGKELYCDKDNCIRMDSYDFERIILPARLIGSFPISLAKFPTAAQNDMGICLLYANPDFSTPLAILGASEFNNQFMVALTNDRGIQLQGRYALGGAYTAYMSKERFMEWINLHVDKPSRIELILHFYDSPYEIDNNGKKVSILKHYMPTNIVDIVQSKDNYPTNFSHSKTDGGKPQDVYEADKAQINQIMTQYRALFVKDFGANKLKPSAYNSLPAPSPKMDESSRIMLYDDKINLGSSIYIADRNQVDLDARKAAYRGQSGISLKGQGDFIQFGINFKSPRKITDFDYVEFYQRTTGKYYNMYVFGTFRDQDWYDESNSKYLQHMSPDFEPYYKWLGVINPLPEDKSNTWALIRIPAFSFSRDESGKINGISFAYFSAVGEVNLDEISLVKELKP